MFISTICKHIIVLSLPVDQNNEAIIESNIQPCNDPVINQMGKCCTY